MNRTREKDGFREKESLYSIPMRKGEELRFTVVEVDGKTRADIRYFSERENGEIRPTTRGIMLDPGKLGEIEIGVRKLSECLARK